MLGTHRSRPGGRDVDRLGVRDAASRLELPTQGLPTAKSCQKAQAHGEGATGGKGSGEGETAGGKENTRQRGRKQGRKKRQKIKKELGKHYAKWNSQPQKPKGHLRCPEEASLQR